MITLSMNQRDIKKAVKKDWEENFLGKWISHQVKEILTKTMKNKKYFSVSREHFIRKTNQNYSLCLKIGEALDPRKINVNTLPDCKDYGK